MRSLLANRAFAMRQTRLTPTRSTSPEEISRTMRMKTGRSSKKVIIMGLTAGHYPLVTFHKTAVARRRQSNDPGHDTGRASCG